MKRLIYQTARAALGVLAFVALLVRLQPTIGPAGATVAAAATTILILYLTTQEPSR